MLLGRKPPIAEPLLNAQVTGQDGILNAIYRGKLYWFYGDTNRLSYALGNFSMTGATTELPDKIDPSVGFNLHYFTGKDGFVKPMVPDRRRGRGVALRPGRAARRVRSGADAGLLPAAAGPGRGAGERLRRLQRREAGVREAQDRAARPAALPHRLSVPRSLRSRQRVRLLHRAVSGLARQSGL